MPATSHYSTFPSVRCRSKFAVRGHEGSVTCRRFVPVRGKQLLREEEGHGVTEGRFHESQPETSQKRSQELVEMAVAIAMCLTLLFYGSHMCECSLVNHCFVTSQKTFQFGRNMYDSFIISKGNNCEIWSSSVIMILLLLCHNNDVVVITTNRSSVIMFFVASLTWRIIVNNENVVDVAMLRTQTELYCNYCNYNNIFLIF